MAMTKSLQMVDELIQLEERRDEGWIRAMNSLNKSQYAVGKSAMLMHLKNLRELIEIESKEQVKQSCKCGK